LGVIIAIGCILSLLYVSYINGCLGFSIIFISIVWFLIYKSDPKMHNIAWKCMVHGILHPRTRLS